MTACYMQKTSKLCVLLPSIAVTTTTTPEVWRAHQGIFFKVEGLVGAEP